MSGLRYEDRLDGESNFCPWKERIKMFLQVDDLWDIVESTETNPIVVPNATTDVVAYAIFNKKSMKAKKMILDSVKDHVIHHVAEKAHAYEMWNSLLSLYQNLNENRKMVLREKLRNVKMIDTENVASYLTRISKIRDELSAIGEAMTSPEMVRTTLNGFSGKWKLFVKGVVSKENLLGWERLWDDFFQEEIRDEALEKQSPSEHSEENVALLSKSKGKAKTKFVRDFNKVRCYQCNQYGHFSSNCLTNKDKKQTTASAFVKEFATQFEKEFSLVSFVSSTNSSSLQNFWIVDSGSTKHMTSMWSAFQEIVEMGPGCYFVETSLNQVQEIRGIGCVKLRLEEESLVLKGVRFALGLRTNLISVSALEDEGYSTLFRTGQVFLYPSGRPNISFLLGDRRDKIYVLRRELVYAESEDWHFETEDDEIVVANTQMIPSEEESESLHSTGSRLGQYGEIE